VTALLLPGCGDEGDSGTGAEATVTSGATTPAKQPAPQSERRRVPAGDFCQSQLGSFIGAMDSLRRRLAVGVTYDQYVNEVRGIRSIYGEIPVQRLRIDCLAAVATPGEKAFNRYIEAANDWGECVSELGCGSGDVEPVLQRRWRIASRFLAEAVGGLRPAPAREER
jgi:hypothetical protein